MTEQEKRFIKSMLQINREMLEDSAYSVASDYIRGKIDAYKMILKSLGEEENEK